MQYEEICLIFNDLINGYSKRKFDNKNIFVKHHDLKIELESNQIYFEFFEKYKSSGLPTIEEKIKFLKEENEWTDEDEKFIQSNFTYLKNLQKTKTKLVIKSQINEIEKTINKIEKDLFEKAALKEKLIGRTCEKEAAKNKEEYQIFNSIFKDKNLKEKFLSEEEWEYVDFSYVINITNIYYEVIGKFDDNNIKKLATHPLFYNHFITINKESPCDFFSKKPIDMTFFQQKLINYGKNIRYIIENCEIPDDIINNYDEIVDFYKRKTNQKISKSKNESAAYSMVGADKSDMKKAGIDTSTSITPFDMLKKSGKQSLNKKDFLNTMNPV